MIDPTERRVRCSRCGTEQNADGETCMMCGGPLGGRPDPGAQDPAGAADRHGPSVKMAAALSQLSEARRHGTPLVVDSGARSDSFAVRASATIVMALVAIVSLAVGIWMSRDLRQASAARERVEADVRALSQRIEDRRKETGLYPDRSLWQQWTANGEAPFRDPWGRAYEYRLEPKSYTLSTLGADGAAGGSGADEDRTFVFRYSIKEGAAPLR